MQRELNSLVLSAVCMVSIQERFIIKSGLYSGARTVHTDLFDDSLSTFSKKILFKKM